MLADPAPTTRPTTKPAASAPATRPVEDKPKAEKPKPPRPHKPAGPPDKPFEPFKAKSKDDWSLWRIGHLFRRAAFGLKAEWLEMAQEKGPEKTIDWLFDFDPKGDVGGFNSFLEQAEGLFDVRRDMRAAQSWWCHRMVRTPHPLQEKLAVFWHDHFATSASKVGRADWMHDQIQLFRTDGLGSFRDLLVKVGRGPAMLRWLDGDRSTKNGPNENYAREIMELFTLGVGNYTEKDLRELARAFTGWVIRGSEGHLEKNRFDDGEKTAFGQTGKWDDEGAVDLILSQPPAPKFIATKLLQEFVHPEPKPEHVEHYAKRLLDHKWEILPVLKEMLNSRLFFSEWAYRSRVKSPAELVVGGIYAMGGIPKAEWMRDAMNQMGQNLLYPPDVDGWEGGIAWINSNTVMVRFNFGLNLSQQSGRYFVRNELYSSLRDEELKEPEALLAYFTELLIDGDLPESLEKKLLEYMTLNDKNKPTEFKFDRRAFATKVRGAAHLLMTAPAFQLA